MAKNNKINSVKIEVTEGLPDESTIRSDSQHGFDITEKAESINKAFEETKRDNIFEEIENKYANVEETEYSEVENSENRNEPSQTGTHSENVPTGQQSQQQINTPSESDTPIEVKAVVTAFDSVMATIMTLGCSLFGITIERKHVVLSEMEINRLSKVAAPVWEKYKGSFSIEGVLAVTLLGLYGGKLASAISLADNPKPKTKIDKTVSKENEKLLETMEAIPAKRGKKIASKVVKNTSGLRRGRPKKQVTES